MPTRSRAPDNFAGDQQAVLLADEAAFEKASRLFRAVGDTARLRLLAMLSQRAMSVTEIAEVDGDSLSTISQRLRVLRSENLVIRKRIGKQVNYALADQHVMHLIRNALAHAAE